MTTVNSWQARREAIARAWRGFGRWRRARPFWGGLLTALAGLEIFYTTQMDLEGLTLKFGPTGFLSWLIPTILVACGLLLWFTPQHRMFYAIVAAVTAVYSLIAVNLGGFFVGLLLGLFGSALAFAWVPKTKAAPDSAGPEVLPQPRNPLPADPGKAHLGVALLVALGVAAASAIAVPKPAQAEPCPEPPATAVVPTTEPEPAEPTGGDEASGDGNLLTDAFNGLINLLSGGGGQEESSTPGTAASPTGVPDQPDGPGPTPTDCPAAPAPDDKSVDRPDNRATKKPQGKPTPPAEIPILRATAGQPRVAKTPSELTGSSVTMTNLRYDGLVDLPTADGTTRVLQFSMSSATTRDFRLRVPGRNETMDIVSDTLTISGNVKFYASRFSGRLPLLGRIAMTPEQPALPEGFTLPLVPITFSDVQIGLVFVDCDKLTAKPLDLGFR
ncbi:MAG TPA: DUF6114 domain-containing protein [Micromonosporaceae bacterium]